MARVDADGMIFAFDANLSRLLGVPVADALGGMLDTVAPLIDGAWRDITQAARDTPGLSRRTVPVSLVHSRLSLDVVGWSSKEAGSPPFVTLLIAEAVSERLTPPPTGNVERARFAREIHDGLAQDLWLAKLTASRLARHPTLDAEGRALCADVLRSIEAGLMEARTAVMALRPLNGPTIALSELVQRQVEEFSDRFGIRSECHLEDGAPIEARVSVELLRILQEALNNVRKHAGARLIVVRLEQGLECIKLSLRDDGSGFDSTCKSNGYGRQSMRERSHSIGARLKIESVPGRGTRVTVRMPVGRQSAS